MSQGTTTMHTWGQPSHLSRLSISIWLGIGVFCTYLFFAFMSTGIPGNERAHVKQAHAFLQGQIHIDAIGDYDRSEYKGKLYSNKPPGYPLVLTPAVVVGRIVGVPLPRATGRVGEPYPLEWFYLHVYNSAITTLTVLLTFFVVCKLTSTRTALTITLGLAFGTLLLPYAGTVSSHSFTALLACGAISALLRYRETFSTWALVLCALCLSWITLSEVACVVYAAPFAVFCVIICRSWRDRIVFCMMAMPAAMLFLGFNWLAFESPFRTGYKYYVNPGYVSWQSDPTKDFFNNPIVPALRLLFDFGKGMFIFSPFMIFVLPGIKRWFEKGDRLVITVILISSMMYFFFIASSTIWHGGICVGPRYLILLIPVLCMIVGYAYEHGSTMIRRLIVIMMVLAVVPNLIGVFVHNYDELLQKTVPNEPADDTTSIFTLGWWCIQHLRDGGQFNSPFFALGISKVVFSLKIFSLFTAFGAAFMLYRQHKAWLEVNAIDVSRN